MNGPLPPRARPVSLPVPRSMELTGCEKCRQCSALCCKYFALELDEPTEPEDWDKMLWYVAHDASSLYIEDGKWFLMVESRCSFLQPDNLCGIYENRPQICRDYSTDGCEFGVDEPFQRIFRTFDELLAYMRENGIRRPCDPKPPAKARSRRSKPAGRRPATVRSGKTG